MVSSMNNLGVVFALALVTLSGFLLPIAVSETIGSHDVVFEGTPIADTIFSGAVSEKPDPAMLLGGEMNRTQDTLCMRADYSPLVTVNRTEAITRARAFLSGVLYLANRTLSPVEPVYNPDYTQGRWYLAFEDDEINVWVSVNAISGKITGFGTAWVSEAPNPDQRDVDTANILNMSAVEVSALQFFKSMNYTLSPYTMVVPPVLETSPMYFRGSTFVLRFYCTMNDTLIDGNQVFLHIDIATGEVLSFGYYWTYFRQVPAEHVVSASVAEHAALAYVDEIRNYTAVRVTSSLLFLENTAGGTANTSDFRLEWIVRGTFHSSFSQDAIPFFVRVYPLSGVPWFLGEQIVELDSSVVKQPQVSMPLLASILGLSLAVAAVSLLLVRKHIAVVSISLEQTT